MVVQRPLVLISGEFSELPPGDTAEDIVVGNLTAGSGLTGGGSLSSNTSVSVALAPAASGLILIGTGDSAKLGDDGAAERLADAALSSGNFALSEATAANASGEASVEISTAAIASGDAAINIINDLPEGQFLTVKAGTPIISGSPVGANAAAQVETIRKEVDRFKIAQVAGSRDFYGLGSGVPNDEMGLAYLPTSNRAIAFFEDDKEASYLIAKGIELGTNGTSVSIGQSARVGSTTNILYCRAIGHPAEDRAVVFYADTSNSNYLTAASVSINPSDNSVSVGTTSVLTSQGVAACDLDYDPVTQQIIYGVESTTTPEFSIINLMTVSGSDLSVGYEQYFQSDVSNNAVRVSYDANQSGVLCFARNVEGQPVAGFYTISGVSLTQQAPAQAILPSRQTNLEPTQSDFGVQYDFSTGKHLFVYEDQPAGTYAVPITVSGSKLLSALSEGFEPTVLFSNSSLQVPALSYNQKLNTITHATEVNQSGFIQSLRIAEDNSILGGERYVFPECVGSGWTSAGDAIDLQNPQSVYYSGQDCTLLIGYFASPASFTLNSGAAVVFKQEYPAVAPTNEYRQNNFLGISQQTVSSGEDVVIRLTGSIDTTNANLSGGVFYYPDTVSSGLTANSTKPTNWSGEWQSIGMGVSSDKLSLVNPLSYNPNGISY